MDNGLQQQDELRRMRPGAIAAGAMMLLLGAAMLLDRSGVLDLRIGRLIGPLFLITLGALIITERGGDGLRRVRRRRGNTAGLWLIGIGAWMLLSQTHMFGLDAHTSWPLLIILAGTIMLIRGVR